MPPMITEAGEEKQGQMGVAGDVLGEVGQQIDATQSLVRALERNKDVSGPAGDR